MHLSAHIQCWQTLNNVKEHSIQKSALLHSKIQKQRRKTIHDRSHERKRRELNPRKQSVDRYTTDSPFPCVTASRAATGWNNTTERTNDHVCRALRSWTAVVHIMVSSAVERIARYPSSPLAVHHSRFLLGYFKRKEFQYEEQPEFIVLWQHYSTFKRICQHIYQRLSMKLNVYWTTL